MKNTFKKNIAQKGGLMIEALAMLGLIAVVTPTMYKKSAERTLEVEDINTADTVRSYMGATEAYMAANYRGLIKEMTENEDGTPKEKPETIRNVSFSDIESYLPYGYANGSKGLYDYDEPEISIFRQGSNLSAFALFPAKAEGGLGQERTARIASLIGANGGYTKSNKSAHGIGGVWNLEANGNEDEPGVKELFPDHTNPNEFSLVTASSNVINSASGAGQVENTKYLQRTKENDEEELWRNTMRTDLYMGSGGATDSNDPDLISGDSDSTRNFSILNINSLIVGAEKDMAHLEEQSDESKNGLYINPDGNNPNAYIGGTLTAAKDQLFANEEKFAFGTPSSTEGEGGTLTTNYRFEADKHGNVTGYGNVSMGKMDSVAREINGEEATEYMIKGELTEEGASLSLLSPDVMQMTTDETEIDTEVDNVTGTHVMIENTGFKGADGEEGKDSNNNDIEPSYTNEQNFPVAVGSNMMVKGVLSAGQMDAQHLRTASLSTGSEHIDDEYKWMTVDKDGIVMQDIGTTTSGEGGEATTSRDDSTYVQVNSDGVLMRTGSTDNGASVTLSKHQEDDTTYGDIAMVANNSESTITAKNDTVGMQIGGTDIQIGNPTEEGGILLYDEDVDIDDNPYRVVMGQGGNFDVVGTNLKIMDMYNQNVLTVRANDLAEEGDDNKFNDFSNFAGNDDIDYSITAHGNILFSSKSRGNTATDITGYDQDDTVHYMAIGPDDDKAGVNIVEGTATENEEAENNERVVFVDLSKRSNNAYVDTGDETLPLTNEGTQDEGVVNVEEGYMNPGTVYIRKGLVEITPDRANLATQTNDGFIDTPSKMGANEGSGIVRASRLVANNVNIDGQAETVPDLLNRDIMNEYNGTSDGQNGKKLFRYDTYMVNPAYTSVMKDIKLTTRGGARLSDILPDFITKGIYLANNTYDDALLNMKFILQNDGFEIDASAMGVPSKYVDSETGGLKESPTRKNSVTVNNWASPYSGLVPAPQCPPGYGRVITVNPFRFEMAQAGQLRLAEDDGYEDDLANASGYYVNTMEMTNKLKADTLDYGSRAKRREALNNELIVNTPQIRKLEVNMKDSGGNMAITAGGGLKADGKAVTGSDTFSVSSMSGLDVEASYNIYQADHDSQQGQDDYSNNQVQKQTTSYVLSVGSQSGMRPLLFQQSTWFHTEAVPVVPPSGPYGDSNGTESGYNGTGKYVRGWAILQGFLYDQREYVNFACSDTENCKEFSTSHKDILWNLFPVAKNTIGSYVQTYCYFDRNNYTAPVNSSYWNSGNHFEKYDILGEVPVSYKKGEAGTSYDANKGMVGDELRQQYYEQLNDPTMKYNEVW